MPGAEYLSPDVLHALWHRLTDWTRARIFRKKSIAAFLRKHAPAWSRVGRVTLHLAARKNDPVFRFAFMASYASGLTQSGCLTQVPPARTSPEAYEFLRDIPALEDVGLLVRLPNWWQNRGRCPQVAATIGEEKGTLAARNLLAAGGP